MKIYQYPKCSTCKNALEWLDSHNLDYESINISTNPPSASELKEYYKSSNLPLKRFFNTSGLKYKELNLKEKLPSMSEDKQLELLSQNGMLIKRPLVIADNVVLLGFKENEWEENLI